MNSQIQDLATLIQLVNMTDDKEIQEKLKVLINRMLDNGLA